MEPQDHTKIVVLETRFDIFEENIQNSLLEIKTDFQEFKKANSEEHKETKAALAKLQSIVTGGLAIIGFISFMSAARPFIMDLIPQPEQHQHVPK